MLAASLQAVDGDLDQLLKIFVAARKKSLDDIGEHLADFRQKRLIGSFLIVIHGRVNNIRAQYEVH